MALLQPTGTRASLPNRSWALTAVTVALAILVGVAVVPSARATTPNSHAVEWDFLNLMNRERWSRGMEPLAMVQPAQDVARAWSTVISSDGELRHNPAFAAQLAVGFPTWRRAGENVGAGAGVAQLHGAFMNSPTHSANILGDFQWVGIGVRSVGSRLWVTANFVSTTTPIAWKLRTPVTRLGAASDPDSSALVSARIPSGTATAVVVARADQFADALSGGPLAAAHNGSVLLVPRSGVPGSVLSEARRILTANGRVIILGGTAALPPAIEESFRALGLATERISGVDRYSTAVAVAPRVNANPTSMFLVSGVAFPDAVAASGAASASRSPILLVGPKSAPPVTVAYLASQPVVPRVVVGGPAAVSDAAGHAAGMTQRVHGADRYATAVNVANTFFPAASRVVLASGSTFADALVAGPAAARQGAPLILTASAPGSSTYGYIATQGERWVEATVVGNATAVPESVVQLLFS